MTLIRFLALITHSVTLASVLPRYRTSAQGPPGSEKCSQKRCPGANRFPPCEFILRATCRGHRTHCTLNSCHRFPKTPEALKKNDAGSHPRPTVSESLRWGPRLWCSSGAILGGFESSAESRNHLPDVQA